jgi:hypothetical protein
MDERQAGGPRPGDDDRATLSPVRAFFLLGALVAAVAVAALSTRDAAPSEPPAPPRSPSYELTDTEAIAEFERLNAQLMQAYEERNIALAEAVFTTDSPMLPRVRKEIETLVESSVVSKTRFDEISTRVTDSSSNVITVTRVEILHPRFETETGRNASRSSQPERTRSQWTLRVERGQWLLHDAVVVERRILKERAG